MQDGEWARPEATDDFVFALGAVTYWSGRVEGQLFWLAASLIDGWYDGYEPDERAVAATRGLSFEPLTQLVTRVLDLDGREANPDLRQTLKDATALMKERNRYVHGEWWPDEGEPDLAVTHRSWGGIKLDEVPVENLRNLATNLANVAKQIGRARDELHRKTR